jgi:hypothetical protein
MGENLNLLIHMGVSGVKQYIFLRSLVLEILLTFHEWFSAMTVHHWQQF